MSQTILVGILNDKADDVPAPDDLTEWLEREIEAVRSAGRLDAAVSFVHAYGLGLPSGTAEAIERAYMQLVDQNEAMIVGPAIGDNALVATPLAERLRVPTINWAGAERARGKYMFQHQVGSHEDESLVMARHMAASGATRLGVIYDLSSIGTRHLRYLEAEAAILGIGIAESVGVSPLADDVGEEVAKVLARDVDGFVYLGLGLSAPATAHALRSRGWEGPRIMNTAGLRGYFGDFAQACDGWTYIDMHSDQNRTLRALCERMGIPRQQALAAAKGHDLGRLVAEGLARARSHDREGGEKPWSPVQRNAVCALRGRSDCEECAEIFPGNGEIHASAPTLRRWLPMLDTVRRMPCVETARQATSAVQATRINELRVREIVFEQKGLGAGRDNLQRPLARV